MKSNSFVSTLLLMSMLATGATAQTVTKGGASNAHLYVPMPPGNSHLIFTNAGSKPMAFRSLVYLPGRPPSPLPLVELEGGRTTLSTGGSSVPAFQVIEVPKPGLQVSAAMDDLDEGSSFRLPVFTSRDAAPRRSPITFQFSPELQPHENVVLVVLSVGLTSTCAVSLYDDSGEVSSSSFTVPENSQLASVNLAPPAIVTYARLRCSRPVLAYSYRFAATTIEFVPPSVSQ